MGDPSPTRVPLGMTTFIGTQRTRSQDPCTADGQPLSVNLLQPIWSPPLIKKEAKLRTLVRESIAMLAEVGECLPRALCPYCQ